MHKGTYADDCIVNRVEQVCVNVSLRIRYAMFVFLYFV